MGIGRGIYFPTTAPTCSIVRKAHTVQFVSIRNNNWGVLSQDIRAPAAAAAGTWYWAERETLKNRRKKKQRYALRRIWLVDTVDRLLHLAFLGPMHIHVYITQVPWSSTNQNAPRRHLLFSLSSFFRLVLSLVVCVCAVPSSRQATTHSQSRDACVFFYQFLSPFRQKKRRILSGIIIILNVFYILLYSK